MDYGILLTIRTFLWATALALVLAGLGFWLMSTYGVFGWVLTILGLVCGIAGTFWPFFIRLRLQNPFMLSGSPPDATSVPAPIWVSVTAIIIVVSLVACATAFATHHMASGLSNYDLDQQWGHFQYMEIWNRHFKDETVPLDGYSYRNCTFSNVTFTYEGIAPVHLELGGTTFGKIHFHSTSPPVKVAWQIVWTATRTLRPEQLDFKEFAPWEH